MRSETERLRYHAIRETCIFDLYHHADGPYPCRYDPGHPDENHPAHHPLVMVADGVVVGTIRIDLKPDGRAVLRLIAVAPEWRGAGLGARMLELAEDFARAKGATRLCVNARGPAVGFYARGGFIPARWDGCTACPDAVPMQKPMGGLPLLLPPPATPTRKVARAA